VLIIRAVGKDLRVFQKSSRISFPHWFRGLEGWNLLREPQGARVLSVGSLPRDALRFCFLLSGKVLHGPSGQGSSGPGGSCHCIEGARSRHRCPYSIDSVCAQNASAFGPWKLPPYLKGNSKRSSRSLFQDRAATESPYWVYNSLGSGTATSAPGLLSYQSANQPGRVSVVRLQTRRREHGLSLQSHTSGRLQVLRTQFSLWCEQGSGLGLLVFNACFAGFQTCFGSAIPFSLSILPLWMAGIHCTFSTIVYWK
jgi:hypothetical protein